MRKRISDNNIFPVFSMETEYRKLQELFYDRDAFGKVIAITQKVRPSLSYADCIHAMFLDWNLRGTFTSVEEMMAAFEISEDDFADIITEDRFLDYIQFLLNAIVFVDEQVKRGRYAIYRAGDTIFNAIVDNCIHILNKLGAEIAEGKNEIFIAYKDDVASAVAACNEDLSGSIVEYLKIDNRGDLQRKGEILCTFAKKLEPFEKIMNGSEFKALCTDTTTLMNNIGARHALKPEDKLKAKFMNMDEGELEKWYDRAFHMFLGCMAVIPYLDIKSEIKAIKRDDL